MAARWVVGRGGVGGWGGAAGGVEREGQTGQKTGGNIEKTGGTIFVGVGTLPRKTTNLAVKDRKNRREHSKKPEGGSRKY
jgi:hypothetical protein